MENFLRNYGLEIVVIMIVFSLTFILFKVIYHKFFINNEASDISEKVENFEKK